MNKYKYFKKIPYILICFIMLFCGTVEAKKNYDTTFTKDLYEKCNSGNSCITLCVYDSINDDNYDKIKGIINENENAYIGYYFDTNKWQFGTLQVLYQDYQYGAYLNTYNGTSIIPYSDIYWSNLKKDWKTSSPDNYRSLNDNFQCPEFFYSDYKGYGGNLCLDNEEEKCKQQKITGSKFGKAHPLTYDFSEKVVSVVDDTYNKMLDGDNEVINLFRADPLLKDKYDNTISAEENIKNNCSYFKGKDTKQYANQLVASSNDYIQNVINPLLAQTADSYDSRNKSVYTFENLSKILVLERDSNGNPTKTRILHDKDAFETLNNLYSGVITYGLRRVDSVCDNINIDVSEFNKEINSNLQDKVHKVISVDIHTELDCDTLFSDEIVDIIKNLYFAIEIGAIIITIALTVLDYAKVILNSDQDGMKKANKRLLTRLIVVVVIFLLPAILNLLLKIFNIEGFNSDNPLCIKNINK